MSTSKRQWKMVHQMCCGIWPWCIDGHDGCVPYKAAYGTFSLMAGRLFSRLSRQLDVRCHKPSCSCGWQNLQPSNPTPLQSNTTPSLNDITALPGPSDPLSHPSFRGLFSINQCQSVPTSPIIFCDHHPNWQKRTHKSFCGTMTIFHRTVYSLPGLTSLTPLTPPLPFPSPTYPLFRGLLVDKKS